MPDMILKDHAASDMLRSWGCTHACGKTVFGKACGTFREYSKGHTDIVDVFVVTPAGRVPAARAQGAFPKGFEVKVHLAAEGLTGPAQIVDRYWKLVTIYADKKLVKHVRPDGTSRLEVLTA